MPRTADIEEVAAMQDSDVEEWRISWADGTERTTTLAGMAFYAREWDDDATVVAL